MNYTLALSIQLFKKNICKISNQGHCQSQNIHTKLGTPYQWPHLFPAFQYTDVSLSTVSLLFYVSYLGSNLPPVPFTPSPTFLPCHPSLFSIPLSSACSPLAPEDRPPSVGRTCTECMKLGIRMFLFFSKPYLRAFINELHSGPIDKAFV